MNDGFLRNFFQLFRPKGLLTREPGEPPETFEQLQKRALERERAEEAQQQAATGDFRAQGAAPKKTSRDYRREDEVRARARQEERRRAEERSSRREAEKANPPPRNGLADASEEVRKAENIVRKLEQDLARVEANIRRWEAQGRILKRSRTPKIPHKVIDRFVKGGRFVLEHVATPANLESNRERREELNRDLPEAKQHLQRMREKLRRLQE